MELPWVSLVSESVAVMVFVRQIRQREEEIAALTLRVEVSEGRARRISEGKDAQIRSG